MQGIGVYKRWRGSNTDLALSFAAFLYFFLSPALVLDASPEAKRSRQRKAAKRSGKQRQTSVSGLADGNLQWPTVAKNNKKAEKL